MSSAAANRMIAAANRVIICRQPCESSQSQLSKTSRITEIDPGSVENDLLKVAGPETTTPSCAMPVAVRRPAGKGRFLCRYPHICLTFSKILGWFFNRF